MRSKTISLILVLILSMIVLTNFVTATNIIAISSYENYIKLENNKLIFEKHISLKNTGKNTIIPGELHFKLYEISDKDVKTIPKISNLASTDKYDNDLSARIVTRTDDAEVIISAWQPIMPQFEYSIILKYEMEFKPRGILFHNIDFPDEETTIPIQSSFTSIEIPKKYSVSYAPNATVTKEDNYKKVEWKNINEKTIEYTLIPFPNTKVHGATLFWVSLIILLTIPLAGIIISELKSRK
ncbi:hypothetical protein JXM83_07260 [Candidatus Woesearchaeota archaeon]|nr:hypothetical protein [Candidatus Woesearchaeota archaeon]